MLTRRSIKELSTRYLAQVNSIAASKEHSNPYLSHRLFHTSPKLPKTDQHFSFQLDIIQQDEYAISLFAHKFAGVTSSTRKLIVASPAPTTTPSANTAAVLNAAAHAKNAVTGKAALKEVLPLLEKRPNDVGLLLTIMNLYILTNNHTAATHLLESFFRRLEQSGTGSNLDVRFAPGLVAALVSLYAHQGRHGASKNELAKAAEYWRKPHKSETATPSKSLMTAAGTALLQSQNQESLTAAGEIFGSLYAQDKIDRAAIAGLVAAYSLTDPSQLTPDLVDLLPKAERLVQDIDAAALEDAGVPSATPASATTQPEATRKRAVESKDPTKSRKIRKRLMPKDFDPNKKMDPERWLPMRDRTYYRPKGKKGKKKAEGLTQGGPVAEDKAPAAEVKTGGGGQAKGAKKKKGKGGKR